MKKIVKMISGFAIVMAVTCGMVCGVASASVFPTGKYAYMSGTIEPSHKGIVAVKNTSNVKRYINIHSTQLGNNSGAVASGNWIRQSKDNVTSFSATAKIRKNKSSTSAIVETLKLTV